MKNNKLTKCIFLAEITFLNFVGEDGAGRSGGRGRFKNLTQYIITIFVAANHTTKWLKRAARGRNL